MLTVGSQENVKDSVKSHISMDFRFPIALSMGFEIPHCSYRSPVYSPKSTLKKKTRWFELDLLPSCALQQGKLTPLVKKAKNTDSLREPISNP